MSIYSRLCNDLEFTRFLIENGTNVNNFYILESVHNMEMLKLLVNIGADVNIRHKDCPSVSILHFAETVEKAEYLISLGMNPFEKDENGMTPFHHAVQHLNLELVKFYIKLGVDKTLGLYDKRNVLHILSETEDYSRYYDEDEDGYERSSFVYNSNNNVEILKLLL